jgi:hypothetical protein
MSTENNVMDDDNVDDQTKNTDADKDKIEENIQIRLERQARKHAQERAEAEARHQQELAALKAQQAQQAPAQTQQGMPAPGQPMGQPMQQGIPAQPTPEQIIAHHEAQQKSANFQQKLAEAAEKDPEFEKLIGNAQKGLPQTGNPIAPYVLNEVEHLDNAPAVLKHLKKNNKDYAVANAIYNRADRIKFFNELSDKLASQQSTPRPPEFEPEPDLANNGSSGQDFDLKTYMKQKGK